MYSQIDTIIDAENKCCKPGCSFCCHQQIEIMESEKPVIIDYIKLKINIEEKEKIKNDLNIWLNFFDENTPDNKILNGFDIFLDFRKKCAKQVLKCPFLINNLCSIYEVRPLACRVHYVLHNPELCDKDKERETAEKGSVLRQHVINRIKIYEQVSLIPLTYAVASILLPDRKLKPMEKVTI